MSPRNALDLVDAGARVRHRRSERAAATVEAVLITPLFLLLVMGIVELGPLFMNWNAVHTASREGARIASVAGTNPKADKQVLDDIAKRRRMSIARLDHVIIFKAATPTDRPPASCLAAATSSTAGVSNLCNVYYPADFSRPASAFGLGTPASADANWSPIDRVDWSDGPPDLVGVYISTRHDTLTGFLPSATLTHTTVFALETRTESG
jgi:Flp pilus assembly protein TadG